MTTVTSTSPSMLADELASVLSKYGTVAYVGIDIDPELKYPKGAARVTFTTTKAFVAAIAGQFAYIPPAETTARVRWGRFD